MKIGLFKNFLKILYKRYLHYIFKIGVKTDEYFKNDVKKTVDLLTTNAKVRNIKSWPDIFSRLFLKATSVAISFLKNGECIF